MMRLSPSPCRGIDVDQTGALKTLVTRVSRNPALKPLPASGRIGAYPGFLVAVALGS
jgi:hypothetical protein